MATVNRFDLLGDDENDNPTQLIAVLSSRRSALPPRRQLQPPSVLLRPLESSRRCLSLRIKPKVIDFGKVNVWSTGVAPTILCGEIDLERDLWPKISGVAKSLILQMLEPDPKLRLTTKEALGCKKLNFFYATDTYPNYMGFPGTIGATYIDCLVTDESLRTGVDTIVLLFFMKLRKVSEENCRTGLL